jgi:hypothetical protein
VLPGKVEYCETIYGKYEAKGGGGGFQDILRFVSRGQLMVTDVGMNSVAEGSESSNPFSGKNFFPLYRGEGLLLADKMDGATLPLPYAY